MNRWTVLVLVVVALSGSGAAATEYVITVEGGIDTPDRQVSLEGSTFTVRGIAEVSPGQTITASVTKPGDGGYRVYVYGTFDGNREIVESTYVDSGSTVSFDTSGYPPGSYTLALHSDGDYRAIYPFIVSGATASISGPSSVESGETITMAVNTDPTGEDVSIAAAEFVLYGNGVRQRIDGTATGDGRFEASIDTSDLPTGEYTLYAVLQNDSRTSADELEPVALSDRHTVTVEEVSSSSGGQSGTTTTTTTTTSTTTTTTTTTSTSENSTTTENTTTTATTMKSTTTATSTNSSPDTTSTSTATTTESGVITPNQTSTSTTPAAAPGFTILTVILSTIAVMVLVRRTN